MLGANSYRLETDQAYPVYRAVWYEVRKCLANSRRQTASSLGADYELDSWRPGRLVTGQRTWLAVSR
jgi:hypothetical protein